MSSLALPAPARNAMWRAQTSAIFATEFRKNFVTKRGFWIYLLAFIPPAIIWLHSFVSIQRPDRASHPMSSDTTMLAGIFLTFFLRPAVFFGCVGIFTYLFRGEVVERTLHYYFLSPVRREVLIAGKYLAGLVTSAFFFCGSIALMFVGMYFHVASHEQRAFYLDGPGLTHLFAYIGITALACMAYGALFTWLGIRYKNPIIPAVVLLLWESGNIFLPSLLKKVSILYFLRSMAPVDPGFYSVGALVGSVAEPASTPVAILALMVITGVLLWLASRELQRSQISYSSD